MEWEGNSGVHEDPRQALESQGWGPGGRNQPSPCGPAPLPTEEGAAREAPRGVLEVDRNPGGGLGRPGGAQGLELICLGLVGMLFGQPDLTCQQLESEVSWGLAASLAITRACISTS